MSDFAEWIADDSAKSALLGAVTGGIFTLMGSLVASCLASKARKSEIQELRNERESALAFKTLAWLADAHAWYSSIKRALDESFEDSATSLAEPGVRVLPLVGSDRDFPKFSTEEMALILHTGDTGLLEKTSSFAGNLQTSLAVIREFNTVRRSYQEFSAKVSISHEADDGGFVKLSMPPETKLEYEMHVSALNQMVADILETCPREMEQARTLISRLQTAYRALPGLLVPTFGFQQEQ